VIDRQEEGFHLYPTMNSVSNGMEDVSRTLEPKELVHFFALSIISV